MNTLLFIFSIGILNALRGFSFGDDPSSPPLEKWQKVFNKATAKGFTSFYSAIIMVILLMYPLAPGDAWWNHWSLLVICFFGMWGWCVKGWSPIFHLTHEEPLNWAYEPQNKLLDKWALSLAKIELVDREAISPLSRKGEILPHFQTESDAIKYSMIWACMRGLFIVPLFVGIGYYGSTPIIGLILGVSCGLLMGPVYRLGNPLTVWLKGTRFDGYAITVVEIIYGLVIAIHVYMLNGV